MLIKVSDAIREERKKEFSFRTKGGNFHQDNAPPHHMNYEVQLQRVLLYYPMIVSRISSLHSLKMEDSSSSSASIISGDVKRTCFTKLTMQLLKSFVIQHLSFRKLRGIH
ncbi:hypothetical protein TNCV_2484641 [Trichonephila clavipes]|uniref:Uncharacterized protein n=1 Tax=Trichonephila clavipes TaxID=2585209 RepID=A0A8X6VZJ4_TRICX|nr:hypothetical protein TNCV_2484641 [Trichonephila clavipes]